MQREIITYPNKRLFISSKRVENFDKDLHKLLDDMYETMIKGCGVGLASIQVNVPLRVFLANIPDENEEQKKEDLFEIINPELKILDDEKIVFNEGCLSIPGFFEDVERYKNVRLEYQDRFGKHKILETSDFLAVVIQHEFDHLNGHLFIEKLSYTKRKAFEKEFKKQQKEKRQRSLGEEAKKSKS
ncbi:peptide deformylase [Campylobacter troglodytis]|uniref:peptide deformylase n=1 Tax=Campylobacter troglodytis TaxID=654363 RepID=UPI001159F19E|nr:peptide deformylase [Campylobacter troglodytis]TQR53068.1 peptide deformylase [Campylobacter troglodytis]